MSEFIKVVLYDGCRVGYCIADEFNKYQYDNNLHTTRIALCDATAEGLEAILDIYYQDTDLFIETIRQELDENFNTLYMN